MQRRGVVVRDDLGIWVHRLPGWDTHFDTSIADLAVGGNDGVGKKARVPWTRVYSISRSRRPTDGWYAVWLFSADGARAYLVLAHSSTKNVPTFHGHPQFVDLSRREATQLMEWGQRRVPENWTDSPRRLASINLATDGKGLGGAYERTTLIGFEYPAEELPSDEEMERDLQDLLKVLEAIYLAQDAENFNEEDLPPEVNFALALRDEGSSRRPPATGGFRLNKAERDAIERRSVEVAADYFKSEGWASVVDTGTSEPFDLQLTSGSSNQIVEVKGTTSTGAKVILTSGEVAAQRLAYPNNALALVTEIDLDKGPPAIARGGKLSILRPWFIEEKDLAPSQYVYEVPRDTGTWTTA